MNTQHLQYIIEIERTRSISQAAENLFLGQPNLSRILRDLEENLGFHVFERTSRGVRPTERGAKFLQHARAILRETEYIDALGPRHAVPNRFRVCIPRSATLLDDTAQYLASIDPDCELDAQIRECHARKTLEILAAGEAEIGIIRFRTEYRDYFEEQSAMRELHFEPMNKYKYQLLMPADHPLAERSLVHLEDLTPYLEIVHGDNFRPRNKVDELTQRKIYSVDRMAQFTLLQTIPGAYMWASALPEQYLERWNLVHKPCAENPVLYHNALIYHPKYAMTEIEAGYLNFIRQRNHI